MKKLGVCKCIEIACVNCPLRIFGCTAIPTTFGGIEKDASWNPNMTLNEVLDAKIDATRESVKDDFIMYTVFWNVIATVEPALHKCIDEEELNHD